MSIPPSLAAVVDRLPLSTRTDLDVLFALGQPQLTVHADYLVVRSPDQPEFHWGNCVHVFDQPGWDDARRWVEVFRAEFPQASWVAVGLPHHPSNPAPYEAEGLRLSSTEAMALTSSHEVRGPRRTPLPSGYQVRQLTQADLHDVVQFDLQCEEGSSRYEPTSYLRFVQNSWTARLSSTHAAFFAAYPEHSAQLVSHLGVVVSGPRARYQTVMTHPEHRRRGLASHVLGVAGEWAEGRGAQEFVIVTEATNSAARLYRRAGFVPTHGEETEAYSYTAG